MAAKEFFIVQQIRDLHESGPVTVDVMRENGEPLYTLGRLSGIRLSEDSCYLYIETSMQIPRSIKGLRGKIAREASIEIKYFKVSVNTVKLMETTLTQTLYTPPGNAVFAQPLRMSGGHVLVKNIERVSREEFYGCEDTV